ncbi:MAG: hypothetical protein AB7I38_03300 [Dehalococcoidia bacterium]
MDSYDATIGARILTADGQDIGAVRDIVGRYFHVDASMAPDYWLPASLITASDPSSVTLAANRDAIGGYEVSRTAVAEERAAEAAPVDEGQMAVEAAAIVWGPDEWAVVRTRILEREQSYSEDELDRMQTERPEETRRLFSHLFEDADRSAERLARTVEENT